MSVICCACLLLTALLSAVDFWCFNRSFYSKEYSELKTADHIGMSKEDLDTSTDVLLSYLKDRSLTLDIEVSIKGENRQVFNQRERDHMIDVRELYLNAMFVRNASFVVFLISALFLAIKKELNHLYYGYKKALIVFGTLFAVIGIFCLIDFDTFWTMFHHIFFPMNNLWLLDPRTDILIMMVPSKFFFDLVLSIVTTIVSVTLLLWILIKTLDKKVFNHA